MGALDQLREEHQVILAVVARMEAAASGGELREAFLRAAVEFMRVYTDRNHHGKEEGALFHIMSRNPRLAGIASLLAEEHVDSRAMIGALGRALDAHDAAEVRRAALDYVWYIRAHIAKEDEMIFDAAERELSLEEAATLERAFAAVEADVLGADGLRLLLAALEAATPANAGA